ncbi:hypothetical protein V8B97DRAFT_1915133 [Scleroderma yunnanense]
MVLARGTAASYSQGTCTEVAGMSTPEFTNHKENLIPLIKAESTKGEGTCGQRKKVIKIEGKRAKEALIDQGKWSDEETIQLIEALLGPDSTVYDTLISYPKSAFHMVMKKVFYDQQSAESINRQYEQLYSIFSHILAFESFTGGGGDPDNADDLENKIEAARKAGKEVGQLSATTLKHWYESGWYMLFNERLGEHPGLSNDSECHSGQLSDIERIDLMADPIEHDNSSVDSGNESVVCTMIAVHSTYAYGHTV